VTDGPHHDPFRYQGGHARIDGRGKMTLEGSVGIASTRNGQSSMPLV